MHLKNNKAADDEGLIAELLQQFHPNLWSELITNTFNA